jgi:hypothetical protein
VVEVDLDNQPDAGDDDDMDEDSEGPRGRGEAKDEDDDDEIVPVKVWRGIGYKQRYPPQTNYPEVGTCARRSKNRYKPWRCCGVGGGP